MNMSIRIIVCQFSPWNKNVHGYWETELSPRNVSNSWLILWTLDPSMVWPDIAALLFFFFFYEWRYNYTVIFKWRMDVMKLQNKIIRLGSLINHFDTDWPPHLWQHIVAWLKRLSSNEKCADLIYETNGIKSEIYTYKTVIGCVSTSEMKKKKKVFHEKILHAVLLVEVVPSKRLIVHLL